MEAVHFEADGGGNDDVGEDRVGGGIPYTGIDNCGMGEGVTHDNGCLRQMTSNLASPQCRDGAIAGFCWPGYVLQG